MLVLGIESSSLVASAALVKDNTLIAEYTVNFKKTHSQTLLPMIDEIFRMTGIEPADIDGIAIAAGPGSFTGLRIGSATAKGLGLALDKNIFAVPTVDAIAYQCYGMTGVVCPIMDARRNQVYTGIYEFTDQIEEENFPHTLKVDDCVMMKTILPQCALSVDELLEKLAELGKPVTFLGDGCPVHEEKIRKEAKVPVRFAPSFMNRQRAAAVAALGIRYAEHGKTETASEHQPDYLRKSQAEREMEEGVIHARS